MHDISFISDTSVLSSLHYLFIRPHGRVPYACYELLVSHVRRAGLWSGHRVLLSGVCLNKSFLRK